MGGGPPGRREHVEEAKFVKELEKMFAQGRVHDAGNVTVSMSRIAEKYVKMQKAGGKKKGKDAAKEAPKVVDGDAKHCIVRCKRQGRTVSCIISADDALRFSANLTSVLRANLDRLRKSKKEKKPEKKAEKKTEAKKEEAKGPAQ